MIDTGEVIEGSDHAREAQERKIKVGRRPYQKWDTKHGRDGLVRCCVSDTIAGKDWLRHKPLFSLRFATAIFVIMIMVSTSEPHC